MAHVYPLGVYVRLLGQRGPWERVFCVSGTPPGTSERLRRSKGSLRESFLRSRDPARDGREAQAEQGVPERGFFAIQGPRQGRPRSLDEYKGSLREVFLRFRDPARDVRETQAVRRVPGREFFAIQGPTPETTWDPSKGKSGTTHIFT